MKENVFVHHGKERKSSQETQERTVLNQKFNIFSSPSLKNVKIEGKIKRFEGQFEKKSPKISPFINENVREILELGGQVECATGSDKASVSTNRKPRSLIANRDQ